MLNELPQPISRKFSFYPLAIFALLALVLGSVSFGLAYLVKDLDFGSLFIASISALLFSWQLGRTKIPGWVVALIFIVLGGLLAIIWVGDLWSLLFAWTKASFRMIWQWLPFTGNMLTDALLWGQLTDEITIRIITLLTEFVGWLRSLVSENPSYNFLAISLVWGYAIWLAACWAGWSQKRRENPWMGVLPAGLLLTLSLGYTYGATTALFPLIFSTLVLAGVSFYGQRERSWKKRGMDYPKDERSENMAVIFGIVLAFVVAAALVPRISIRWLVETLQTWIDPQVEQVSPIFESFGLQQDLTDLGQIGTAMNGGLPRKHLIGAGPDLSEQIVMYVQFDDEQLIGELQNFNVPLYWRAITYDHYTGFGWDSSDIILRSYEAGELAIRADNDAHRMIQQNIRLVEKQELIYAAGEIVSIDSEYSIAWRLIPGITEIEKASGDFFAGSQNQLNYQVDSLIPVVSEFDLRTAGNQYPGWVSARYLALPKDLSPRVTDLARRLGRNAPTPYDKARAIERYLRTYKYELNLPAPPENREIADYFLFELQKGYCDYYATSMVVLARSLGIPARIAIGYTSGNYDNASQEYTVTENSAHSWPELYFPDIGWVAFEPTAAQPEITRPEASLHASEETEYLSGVGDQDRIKEKTASQYWLGLLAILLLALVFPPLWLFLDNCYLRWLSPEKITFKLFKRLYKHAARLGVRAHMGDTPYEFAGNLGEQIQSLSTNSRWEAYLLPTVGDLEQLTHIYVYACFSPYTLQREQAERSISLWRRLRPRLLLLNLLFGQRGRNRNS